MPNWHLSPGAGWGWSPDAVPPGQGLVLVLPLLTPRGHHSPGSWCFWGQPGSVLGLWDQGRARNAPGLPRAGRGQGTVPSARPQLGNGDRAGGQHQQVTHEERGGPSGVPRSRDWAPLGDAQPDSATVEQRGSLGRIANWERTALVREEEEGGRQGWGVHRTQPLWGEPGPAKDCPWSAQPCRDWARSRGWGEAWPLGHHFCAPCPSPTPPPPPSLQERP